MSATWDVIVIGAGPGGYVCAIRCAQLGKKTLVIEKAALGGVCLNVGCIPSKALIHASKVYSKAKNGAHMGVIAGDISVDQSALIGWKDAIVDKLTSGVGTLFKANGVQHRYGTATLAGPGKVSILDADGKTEVLATRNVVLATGSTPVQIPFLPFSDPAIIDSTGALALTERPEHLVVVGGGIVGMELGGVYARLGSKVTVIEALDQVLPSFDKDVVRPVTTKQKKLGVTHLTSTRVTGMKKHGDAVLLTYEGAKPGEVRCDKVLVAVGRRPNSAGLGLDTVGIATTQSGHVPVDAQQRTTAAGVYAIGDLVPGPGLAHKASKEGEVAAEVIAGHGAAMDAVIAAVVYTDPEVASVGPTLAELRAEKRDLIVGKFGFSALGRAMTADATDGFARVIGDKTTGEVLAVQIVGAEASEMINEAAFMLEMAAVVEDVGLTVHAHPTMGEAMMEAAKAALGEAIHAVNR